MKYDRNLNWNTCNITITRFWRSTCSIYGPTKSPDKSLLAQGPQARGPTMTWRDFLKGHKKSMLTDNNRVITIIITYLKPNYTLSTDFHKKMHNSHLNFSKSWNNSISWALLVPFKFWLATQDSELIKTDSSLHPPPTARPLPPATIHPPPPSATQDSQLPNTT